VPVGALLLRLRQRGTVATGAAQARDPLSKVAHLTQIDVAGDARDSTYGAGLAHLARGCCLFHGRTLCHAAEIVCAHNIVVVIAHDGSIFAARFERHVLQHARKHGMICVMVLIIALDYDSVSTGRTLLAVLGFDDPRSIIEERHIKKDNSIK
jgi:hypothetical protein